MRKEIKVRITLAAILFMAAFIFGPTFVVALELEEPIIIPTEVIFIAVGAALSILYVVVFGIGSFDGMGSRNRRKMKGSLAGIWNYVRGYKYTRTSVRGSSSSETKRRKVKVPTRGRGANTWRTGGWKEGKWKTGEGKWPTGKIKSRKKK